MRGASHARSPKASQHASSKVALVHARLQTPERPLPLSPEELLFPLTRTLDVLRLLLLLRPDRVDRQTLAPALLSFRSLSFSSASTASSASVPAPARITSLLRSFSQYFRPTSPQPVSLSSQHHSFSGLTFLDALAAASFLE